MPNTFFQGRGGKISSPLLVTGLAGRFLEYPTSLA